MCGRCGEAIHDDPPQMEAQALKPDLTVLVAIEPHAEVAFPPDPYQEQRKSMWSILGNWERCSTETPLPVR